MSVSRQLYYIALRTHRPVRPYSISYHCHVPPSSLQGVQLVKGVVKEVREKEIELQASRLASSADRECASSSVGLGPFHIHTRLASAWKACQAGGSKRWRLPTCMGIVAFRSLPPQLFHGLYFVVQDGSVLPYGLCIWSTGVGPTPFVLRCAGSSCCGAMARCRRVHNHTVTSPALVRVGSCACLAVASSVIGANRPPPLQLLHPCLQPAICQDTARPPGC